MLLTDKNSLYDKFYRWRTSRPYSVNLFIAEESEVETITYLQDFLHHLRGVEPENRADDKFLQKTIEAVELELCTRLIGNRLIKVTTRDTWNFLRWEVLSKGKKRWQRYSAPPSRCKQLCA